MTETSLDAFVQANHIGNRNKVLNLFVKSGIHGLVDDEIFVDGLLHNNSIRAARGALYKQGLIVKTGETRKTAAKCDAEIYVLSKLRPDIPIHDAAVIYMAVLNIGYKTYKGYLKNPDYKNRSAGWIELHPKCEISGSTKNLKIHHLKYDNLNHEEYGIDVVVLSGFWHDVVEGLCKMGYDRKTAHIHCKSNIDDCIRRHMNQ